MKQIPTATAIPPTQRSSALQRLVQHATKLPRCYGQHRPLQQPRRRCTVSKRRVPWAKSAVKAVGDEPSVALLEERSGQVHPSGCLSQIASCAQQFAVAVGAPIARTPATVGLTLGLSFVAYSD